jgi:uncharacterized protein YggT (Ycf19 family)
MRLLVEVLNFMLATAMWLIVGRVILQVIAGSGANPVLRVLAMATDPVYALIRRIAPQLGGFALPLVALVMLFAGRVLLNQVYIWGVLLPSAR